MSELPPSGFSVRSIEKFDDASWREFLFPHSRILLTSAGAEFVRENDLSFLRDFATAVRNDERSSEPREFLEKGRQGEVFTTSHPDVVIKESFEYGDSLEGGLLRMDKLVHAIEANCPRWIALPKHYGVYIDEQTDREFSLIQRIDNGVTVGDVLTGLNGQRISIRGQRTLEAMNEQFPDLDAETVTEISDMFLSCYYHIKNALRNEQLDPGNYLHDLRTNPDNVVIEKLETPTAGKKYRFWVIDQ